MANIYKFPKNQEDIVYLTPSEREQYENYIEKAENSRTLAEARIYNRKIKSLIEKGKSRA